jgi:hypothetical protein
MLAAGLDVGAPTEAAAPSGDLAAPPPETMAAEAVPLTVSTPPLEMRVEMAMPPLETSGGAAEGERGGDAGAAGIDQHLGTRSRSGGGA